MDLIEKIGKKFGLIKEKSKTEQIQEDRENIKLTIAVKLYQAGFTDDEIENVLSVIQRAEDDIQKIKNSLNGTNINPNGDPMSPLNNGLSEIKKRQIEMQKELNETIQMYMKNH